MRDLINKLTLLESSNSNIRKIASFFMVRRRYDTEAIILPVVIEFPYPFFGKNRKMAFNLTYQSNHKTGELDKLPVADLLTYVDDEQRELEKIFGNEFSDEEYQAISNLDQLILNDLKDLSSNNGKIKAETKNTLLNMGFSNNAADFFITQIGPVDNIGDVGVSVSLPSASQMSRFQSENPFHSEVNAAYEWRQENEG